MDADIRALTNEVAKINPPLHPYNVIGPTIPSTHDSSAPSSYTPSHGPSNTNTHQYHPYNRTSKPTSNSNATTALIHQQMAAQSAMAQAQAQAQLQTARLQAQAAAINAARTRTLMSAAAQAQAVRAAAMQRAVKPNIISSGPNPNKYVEPDEITNSFGPSYTKNNVNTKYNKYNKYNNYKRYDYQYDTSTTTTIPNSSLRNHCHDPMDINNGKPPKKKKLFATHQYQLRTAANDQWVDPTMTDWPQNDFRIFCGDLGNEVSDAMLTSAFSKYPSFAKAKVIRDKRTGKSKGYGFVSFLEPRDFIRAFKEMNGKYVGNRPIKLRRSKWKDRMKKVKNFKIRE